MSRKRNPKPRRVTVIRYEDEGGRRCAKSAPGAKKVKTLTDSYYLELPPEVKGGKKERIALETTDEQTAWEKVRLEFRRRKERSLGITDDRLEQAGRPIAEHLDEWLAGVAAGDVGPSRVSLLRSRVEWLIMAAKWQRITDIKKSSCEAALAKLMRTPGRGKGSAGKGRGASPATRNHYLSHARQFCAWLAADGRLTMNPLLSLEKANDQVDIRHARRCPGELEVRVLFEHLAGLQVDHPPRTIHRSMTPPQRALGYMVAMCSGLRAGELSRLTVASFDLTAGQLKVPARSDKARKKRTVALPRWLCELLLTWLEAGAALWADADKGNLGDCLRGDLAAARAGWIAGAGAAPALRLAREQSTVCLYEIGTEDGPTYWDAHAMRHWYVTQIASTEGISPATLQALARHSDSRLTLGVYTHAKESGARAAVEQLPRLGGAARPDHPDG